MAHLHTLQANYQNKQHGQQILELLDHYAQDPMGGGAPLAEHVRATLVGKLSQLPHAASFLCYEDDRAVGLANCFIGFSTFCAAPLINVHDLVVHQSYRGLGISQLLLAEVERFARNKDCCKITLEVLTGNETALAAYTKYGFRHYQLDPGMGNAIFLQKNLTDDE